MAEAVARPDLDVTHGALMKTQCAAELLRPLEAATRLRRSRLMTIMACCAERRWMRHITEFADAVSVVPVLR